ncbi:hypothetical protein LXL04_001299 [Taraxacum kok-saghyz]
MTGLQEVPNTLFPHKRQKALQKKMHAERIRNMTRPLKKPYERPRTRLHKSFLNCRLPSTTPQTPPSKSKIAWLKLHSVNFINRHRQHSVFIVKWKHQIREASVNRNPSSVNRRSSRHHYSQIDIILHCDVSIIRCPSSNPPNRPFNRTSPPSIIPPSYDLRCIKEPRQINLSDATILKRRFNPPPHGKQRLGKPLPSNDAEDRHNISNRFKNNEFIYNRFAVNKPVTGQVSGLTGASALQEEYHYFSML